MSARTRCRSRHESRRRRQRVDGSHGPGAGRVGRVGRVVLSSACSSRWLPMMAADSSGVPPPRARFALHGGRPNRMNLLTFIRGSPASCGVLVTTAGDAGTARIAVGGRELARRQSAGQSFEAYLPHGSGMQTRTRVLVHGRMKFRVECRCDGLDSTARLGSRGGWPHFCCLPGRTTQGIAALGGSGGVRSWLARAPRRNARRGCGRVPDQGGALLCLRRPESAVRFRDATTKERGTANR